MNLHSESVAKIAAALVKVQSSLAPAAKDGFNPHFQSKYADLGAIWEACREALQANGIAVVQTASVAEYGPRLVTMLLHTSGEYISSEWPLQPSKENNPQAMGSAITYMRRYSLAAMVGVVADEDDDGNAASQPPRQQQSRPAQKPAQSKPKAGKAPPDGEAIGPEGGAKLEHDLSQLGKPQPLLFARGVLGRPDLEALGDLTHDEVSQLLTVADKKAA